MRSTATAAPRRPATRRRRRSAPGGCPGRSPVPRPDVLDRVVPERQVAGEEDPRRWPPARPHAAATGHSGAARPRPPATSNGSPNSARKTVPVDGRHLGPQVEDPRRRRYTARRPAPRAAVVGRSRRAARCRDRARSLRSRAPRSCRRRLSADGRRTAARAPRTARVPVATAPRASGRCPTGSSGRP